MQALGHKNELKNKIIKVIQLYLKNLRINIDLATEIVSELALKNSIEPFIVVGVIDELESSFYVNTLAASKDKSYRDKLNTYGR